MIQKAEQTKKLQNRLLDKEKECIVRRYMDFSKFLSLITTKSLYFAKPSEFTDPIDSCFPEYNAKANDKNLTEICKKQYELMGQAYFKMITSNLNKIYPNNPSREQIYLIFDGHISPIILEKVYVTNAINFCAQNNLRIWEIVDSYIQGKNEDCINKISDFLYKKSLENKISTREFNKRRVIISCWQFAEYESDLMWKCYGNSNAIMIQTKIKNLEKLDYTPYLKKGDACVIDKVNYINIEEYHKKCNEIKFGENSEDIGNDILKHYFEKSKALKDEYELRIIIAENINGNKEIYNSKKGTNIKINMPLDEFIEKIVISPYAPNYYIETLYKTLKQMNYNELAQKIEKSNIKKEQEKILHE